MTIFCGIYYVFRGFEAAGFHTLKHPQKKEGEIIPFLFNNNLPSLFRLGGQNLECIL
jgi:hypothetical protein